MSKTVTWVGGPHDGETFVVDDRLEYLRVSFPILNANLNANQPLDISINTKEFPIRLTANGYRAYWSER